MAPRALFHSLFLLFYIYNIFSCVCIILYVCVWYFLTVRDAVMKSFWPPPGRRQTRLIRSFIYVLSYTYTCILYVLKGRFGSNINSLRICTEGRQWRHCTRECRYSCLWHVLPESGAILYVHMRVNACKCDLFKLKALVIFQVLYYNLSI